MQQVWKNKLDDAIVLEAQTFNSMIFINDKKGGFVPENLPMSMQLAPVYSFLPLRFGNNNFQLFYAGNFFGTLPYEGIYDALLPGLFNYQTKKIMNTHLLDAVTGQVRDLKIIQLANKKLAVLIARNNDKLILLQY